MNEVLSAQDSSATTTGARRIVNHVMSSDTHSAIFSHFIKHLASVNTGTKHIVSLKPQTGARVYHYHRPNLETEIPRNSIATVHHDLTDDADFLDIEKFLTAYRQCHTVVCLNTAQQEILKNCGIGNTVVIPHGAEKGFYDIEHAPNESCEHKVRLGFLSRRYGRKVKGEAYLYQLFQRLNPEIFEFVFVGRDRTEDAWRARDYGFKTVVYENLPYRLFPSLYLKIDVLLVLSKFEGGPACIPEAVASGTPILSTRVGMANDYLKNGINGFFITQDLTQDIDLFNKLCEPNNLANLRAAAHNLKSTAITWKDVALKYDSIYTKIN